MPDVQPTRILVFARDSSLGAWLAEILRVDGHDVKVTSAGSERDGLVARWRPDAAILDLESEKGETQGLVRRLRRAAPATAIVTLTPEGSVADAIGALKAGAHGVVEHPPTPEAIGRALGAALEEARVPVGRRQVPTALIGTSKAVRDLLDLIEAVARSEANILIEGEHGTGKEIVANAIHAGSRRARGPFVKVNCAAIPKDLIEAELFGHRRGAFTGAVQDRAGLLDSAHGGSLLLDEIAEMPGHLQAKLLRVLQEREYRPLGGDAIVRVDFRLISATNVDLAAALRDGRLREDLYFRINTVTVRVPPLRDRVEDIPVLCDHFLATYSELHHRDRATIAPAAYDRLLAHRWPGNVRELENAIERALLVAKDGEIGPDDLPETIRSEPSQDPLANLPADLTLAEIERLAILRTLGRTNWNKQEAAEVLGLYRPTLYGKMKKHGIVDPGRAQRRTRPKAE
jgi:DNA-binding NtrC family response regulator